MPGCRCRWACGGVAALIQNPRSYVWLQRTQDGAGQNADFKEIKTGHYGFEYELPPLVRMNVRIANKKWQDSLRLNSPVSVEGLNQYLRISNTPIGERGSDKQSGLGLGRLFRERWFLVSTMLIIKKVKNQVPP